MFQLDLHATARSGEFVYDFYYRHRPNRVNMPRNRLRPAICKSAAWVDCLHLQPVNTRVRHFPQAFVQSLPTTSYGWDTCV